MNVSFYLSANTSVPMYSSPKENVANEFVITSVAMLSMSHKDSLEDEM